MDHGLKYYWTEKAGQRTKQLVSIITFQLELHKCFFFFFVFFFFFYNFLCPVFVEPRSFTQESTTLSVPEVIP